MQEIIIRWLTLAPVIVVMGMSKGGLPVSGVALPLLVLLWPEQSETARAAVGFMLPLLCLMDIYGATFYHGKADWKEIRALLPATLVGIIVASIFFVANHSIAVTDKALKLSIGGFGIFFTFWNAFGKKILKGKTAHQWKGRSAWFGFLAGLSSTIAHAGGPVMQMNLLPKGWKKEQFAATTIYFFLILNALKLIPFALLGRFTPASLLHGASFIPLIPVGVLCGVQLVRRMKEQYYRLFIQLVLLSTSIILIYKAINQ